MVGYSWLLSSRASQPTYPGMLLSPLLQTAAILDTTAFQGGRGCAGIFLVGLNFRVLTVVAIWDKWLMSQLEPGACVLCPLVVHSGSFSTVAQLLPDFIVTCGLGFWNYLLFMLPWCSNGLGLSGWDFVSKMDCAGGIFMAVLEMHLCLYSCPLDFFIMAM